MLNYSFVYNNVFEGSEKYNIQIREYWINNILNIHIFYFEFLYYEYCLHTFLIIL